LSFKILAAKTDRAERMLREFSDFLSVINFSPCHYCYNPDPNSWVSYVRSGHSPQSANKDSSDGSGQRREI
jgi:hypothetical protein